LLAGFADINWLVGAGLLRRKGRFGLGAAVDGEPERALEQTM
jgi:hypothetical protein